MTLNEIASQIAHSFDRPYDSVFKARLMDHIIANRNILLHREFDKRGIDEAYLQSYVAAVALTDLNLYPSIIKGTNILVSTTTIPKPLRIQSPVPFPYVGTLDGRQSYGYSKIESFKNITSLPLIGSATKYAYLNDLVYINKLTVPDMTILVRYVSERIDISMSNSDYTIWKKDVGFPFYSDMIPTLIDMVTASIRQTKDSANEQPVTHKDQQ